MIFWKKVIKVKEETDKPVEKDGIVLRKRHIVIIVILLLLLLFGGIFVGMNWNKWFGEQGVQPVRYCARFSLAHSHKIGHNHSWHQIRRYE